jgi:L-iditol 2-dehydrogenase
VPCPAIGPGEVLLRVRAASICGTDVKIVRHGHRKLRDGQRIVLGHEFVGTVERVGEGVDDYPLGQRVGVVPNAGCGRCDACLRGQANYCPQYTAVGIDRDGGHAPLALIPPQFVAQGNLVPLPDTVSDQQASLLEPFSCVVNGIRAARIELGDTVTIYGAGPIGLMHVMLARISGAGKIIAVDPREDRLEQARRLGCDVTLNPQREEVPDRLRHETGGEGVDVVITACPVAEVQAEGVRVLAPFGRLCLFGGLPRTSGPVGLDTNAIHYGNFVVTGSTGGSARDYRAALRLVASGRVDLSPVISQVLPLDGLQLAYDRALQGAEGKVVLVAEEAWKPRN